MINNNFPPEDKLEKSAQDASVNDPLQDSSSDRMPSPSGKKKKKHLKWVNKIFSNPVSKAQPGVSLSAEAGAAPVGLPTTNPFQRTLFNKINLQLVNKVLSLVIVLLLALVGYYITTRGVAMYKIEESAIKKIAPRVIEEKDVQPFQSLEVYLNQVEKRNILQPYEFEVEEVSEEEVEPLVSLNEKIGNLKVVARSWDGPGDREAVLKDEDTGETFFVREGQKIGETEVLLKRVYSDKIILSYESEEMEM
jgi:hypothetical protein